MATDLHWICQYNLYKTFLLCLVATRNSNTNIHTYLWTYVCSWAIIYIEKLTITFTKVAYSEIFGISLVCEVSGICLAI